MHPVLGLVCILLGWGILFPGVSGLGYLAARCAGLAEPAPEEGGRAPFDPAMLFWLGFSVLLLLLQMAHLVQPIGPAVTYPILALGYTGFALHLSRGGAADWRRVARFGWLLFPVAAWVAVQAAAGPEIHDDGLYHFQSVQWLNRYPIVPGLGNLDGRLGFNQSYFLYYAFLNVWPLEDRAYHFANGLLLVVLLAQSLVSLRAVLAGRHRAGAAALFQVLLLPMVIREASPMLRFEGRGISSPSPDLPITLFGVVLMTEVIRMACQTPASRRSCAPGFFFIAVFGAAAITIKLSFLVTGGLSLAGALLLAWRAGLTPRSRAVAAALALSAAILLSWMVRGIVTNGYPLYPATALGCPVDWKIPAANVQAMADSIKGFARLPAGAYQPALTGWTWIAGWWSRVREGSNLVPLLWSAAGLGILFPLSRRFSRGQDDLPLWRLLLPGVPIGASLAFWFLAAPDPRFWGAMPSCLTGWLAVLCLLHLPPLLSQRILPVGIIVTATLIALPESPFNREGRRDALDWVKIPKGEAGEFVTRSGLRLFVRAGDPLPWNHKLPLTSYPDPALVQRTGKLRDGFRVEVDPLPLPSRKASEPGQMPARKAGQFR